MHSLTARLHAHFTLSIDSAARTGVILAHAPRIQSLNVSQVNAERSERLCCRI